MWEKADLKSLLEKLELVSAVWLYASYMDCPLWSLLPTHIQLFWWGSGCSKSNANVRQVRFQFTNIPYYDTLNPGKKFVKTWGMPTKFRKKKNSGKRCLPLHLPNTAKRALGIQAWRVSVSFVGRCALWDRKWAPSLEWQPCLCLLYGNIVIIWYSVPIIA